MPSPLEIVASAAWRDGHLADAARVVWRAAKTDATRRAWARALFVVVSDAVARGKDLASKVPLGEEAAAADAAIAPAVAALGRLKAQTDSFDAGEMTAEDYHRAALATGGDLEQALAGVEAVRQIALGVVALGPVTVWQRWWTENAAVPMWKAASSQSAAMRDAMLGTARAVARESMGGWSIGTLVLAALAGVAGALYLSRGRAS
jgi:hypothetical protein